MSTANNMELSAGLNTGEIVECIVEQIMPYGAFVRITTNGRKGMIHISELSYNFVKDINEVLKIQDKVQAKIIKIDERGRIDLSLKQAQDPPAPQARSVREGHENFRQFRTPPKPNEQREQFQNFARREFKGTRDFHELREAYREDNPEEADNFEKKMASFLKTSEAKITDLNTRNSARTGRSSRRRSRD